jgi:hypothetical protein
MVDDRAGWLEVGWGVVSEEEGVVWLLGCGVVIGVWGRDVPCNRFTVSMVLR